MPRANERFVILMADDDEDDRLLAREALIESKLPCEIDFVRDGVELLQYLRKAGSYRDQNELPWPNLILLDLNMPRKDGREVLAELKADPVLSQIPVVILTTANTEQDLRDGIELGAASYRTKPVTFNGMVELMKTLHDI